MGCLTSWASLVLYLTLLRHLCNSTDVARPQRDGYSYWRDAHDAVDSRDAYERLRTIVSSRRRSVKEEVKKILKIKDTSDSKYAALTVGTWFGEFRVTCIPVVVIALGVAVLRYAEA
jgi:hypothetical protein